MKYLNVGDQVILKCSQGTCPRKRRYRVQKLDDTTFPEGTVVVKSKCPWHQDGDFDSEQFFDKDGKELVWQPEDYE